MHRKHDPHRVNGQTGQGAGLHLGHGTSLYLVLLRALRRHYLCLLTYIRPTPSKMVEDFILYKWPSIEE